MIIIEDDMKELSIMYLLIIYFMSSILGLLRFKAFFPKDIEREVSLCLLLIEDLEHDVLAVEVHDMLLEVVKCAALLGDGIKYIFGANCVPLLLL